jgi:DNA-binding protein YbaB
MKASKNWAGWIILLFAAGILAYSQESAPDRAVVNFSNPAKPGTVEVNLRGGSITVKGYEGKEVIVEARWREKLLRPVGEEAVIADRIAAAFAEAKEEEQKAKEKAEAEKAKGMKPIQVESTGLTVEEEENVVSVDVEAADREADLMIQVPFSTSLRISTNEGGEITVDRVDGEIEVNNSEGTTNLNGVSGPVVADSGDGSIKAVFAKINPGKPMSFSAMDGDIDIILPFDAKVSLKMKTQEGKIYTDFDVKLTPSQQKKEEDERKDGGRYRVAFEKTTLGLINGGGVEIQLTTNEGNIYIRKAK